MSLVRRAASLAAVPVRTGARMAAAATSVTFGADREATYSKALGASAEILAEALAKARGPALKFGQTLALFSSMLPPDQAAHLESLTRLYEDAAPRPYDAVAGLLADLPPGVRVERDAVAAASLGQVHRATWPDGRAVAVKVQYPDAHRIVKADLLQLRTMIPLVHRLIPTLNVRALLEEHAQRLYQELVYEHEAHWQDRFRRAWDAHHPGIITVPEVLLATPQLLVTRWIDGTPWNRIGPDDGSTEPAAAAGSTEAADRDRAGRALARFTLWSPSLVGASHADPHPGNYRLLPDGTLGVLDFGSICHPSGPFTRLFARTFELDHAGDVVGLRELWLRTGLIQPDVTGEELVAMLRIDPRLYAEPEVTFSREWTAGAAESWSDPLDSLAQASRLAFPPDLLLEHRSVTGMIALLVGLQATVDFRAVLDAVPDEDGVAA